MVRTGRCNRYRSYIIDEIRAGYNTNASALRVQNLGQGGALGLGQLGPGGAAQKKIAAVQPETIGPGPAQGGYHVRQVMAGLPLVLRMVVIAAVAVPDAVLSFLKLFAKKRNFFMSLFLILYESMLQNADESKRKKRPSCSDDLP